jgi:vacuolar-type H+-ATPase subunit I/STV1
MFGDLGHGFLMTLAAFFLILREKQLANVKGGGEIWDTMYGGRYIIFMMGLFSMYTGFIYNDVFSKSLTLGSSGYGPTPVARTGTFPHRPLPPPTLSRAFRLWVESLTLSSPVPQVVGASAGRRRERD